MSNHTIDKIKTLTEMHGAPNFEQHVREYMKNDGTLRRYVCR